MGTNESPIVEDQNEKGKEDPRDDNDNDNENDEEAVQDVSRGSGSMDPTFRAFNRRNNPFFGQQGGDEVLESGGNSAIGSIRIEIPEEKPEEGGKKIVSIKQKESFFNDKTCRVIFIEEIVEDEKLGQKEMALQV